VRGYYREFMIRRPDVEIDSEEYCYHITDLRLRLLRWIARLEFWVLLDPVPHDDDMVRGVMLTLSMGASTV
jgi:hypothetical protein